MLNERLKATRIVLARDPRFNVFKLPEDFPGGSGVNLLDPHRVYRSLEEFIQSADEVMDTLSDFRIYGPGSDPSTAKVGGASIASQVNAINQVLDYKRRARQAAKEAGESVLREQQRLYGDLAGLTDSELEARTGGITRASLRNEVLAARKATRTNIIQSTENALERFGLGVLIRKATSSSSSCSVQLAARSNCKRFDNER